MSNMEVEELAMVSIQSGAFIYNVHMDPLPIRKLATQDALEVLNERVLNFALISDFVAVYMESLDGVSISSLFDVVVE